MLMYWLTWIWVWHKTRTCLKRSRMVVMSTETVESRAPMYCGTISTRYLQKNMMVIDGSFALKTQSRDKDGIMKVLCCLAGADS